MNFAKGSTSRGRGTSFKGVMAYLTHDKERAQTVERVGEIELVNLFEQDPTRIWQEMKATFNAADYLKQKAGVKASGRKLEKPVYTYSLNWHPQDKPTPAHMMETARETLRLLGLQDHQAAIVQHTDTDHAHVHVVVNMVHPVTGKAASLSNDDYRLTEWAYRYEHQQGVIRSFGRAAKIEGRGQAKAPRQNRSEAQARKGTANDNAAEKSAADIRATFGRRGEAMQDRNRLAQARRKVEMAAIYNVRWNATKAVTFAHNSRKWTDSERIQIEQLRHERNREREELRAGYREAVQQIWAERAPAAPTRGLHTYSKAHSNALARLADRRNVFEQREASFVGRLVNTVTLAKTGSSVTDLLALALNAKARRALFEMEQKADTAAAEKLRPAAPQTVRIATKKMRADQLRAMQAEGLRDFDIETKAQTKQLTEQHQKQRDDRKAGSLSEVDKAFRHTLAETKARHAEEIAGQREGWRVLKQERAEAWATFKAKHYRKPPEKQQGTEEIRTAEATPETPVAAEFKRTATGQPAAPNDGTSDPAITAAADSASPDPQPDDVGESIEDNPWKARRSKAERMETGDYKPRVRGPRMG